LVNICQSDGQEYSITILESQLLMRGIFMPPCTQCTWSNVAATSCCSLFQRRSHR